MAWNVKIILNGRVHIAEVWYFARLIIRAENDHSNPDEDLNTPDPLHQGGFDVLVFPVNYGK
ncbi:hypothetical protein PISMIDRAFT_15888 [Pisolithus microcarpus 441]|uniref:Uncharacterized protein n=1 Tax=Pisolithus microcarpus 441 TaxID=765257 RepID=A0A0C9Z1V5_9AGAM|nr:hypothetical protein PISMIDRAFT_15888 [Pisolithus microcarpus 441]